MMTLLPMNKVRSIVDCLKVNAFIGMLALLSLQAYAATVFQDDFSYPDGLITNEYAEWNPADPKAVLSNAWEMTSGSVFAQRGTGWTGVPDVCGPNATSSNCTNSSVFRLNTKRTFSGNTKVSFSIRQNSDIHNANCETNGTCWYGAHIWLRHVNQFNLYYASIQRADGKVVIKRKVPCGSENSGTYFSLSSYIPNDWQVGNWKKYSTTIGTNADGSVTIKLFDDDKSTTVPVATGIDKGGINTAWSASCTTPGHYASRAYPPITEGGSVGIRGDYANFNFDNFTVTTDAAVSTDVTSPMSGTQVSGTVKIVALTSDDQQVSHVDFYVDGAQLGTGTVAPFSATWNTANSAAGAHVLTAKAFDKAGNAGTISSPISVNTTVATAPPPDGIAPVTRIVAPIGGVTVKGIVNVTANATDVVGVTKVEFYINDSLKLTDTTVPYSYAWDTSKTADGNYALQTKAYDAAGNVGVSTLVFVTVSNLPGVTPTSSAGLTVTSKITSLWSAGSCVTSTIKNVTDKPIVWTVAMPVDGMLSAIWDAIGSQSGSTLSMRGASWNAVLKPGSSVTPGFCLRK